MERNNKSAVALGVSVAALVVALSTTAGAMYGYHKVSESEYKGGGFYAPTEDEIAAIVKDVYATSVNAYMNKEISYDEMSEQIAQMIMDRMNGKFTQAQEAELKNIIKAYVDGTTVYNDIDANKKAIDSISDLLDSRYTENKNYIKNVEVALSQLIKNNDEKNDERYKELVEMDKRLKNWLDEQNNQLTSEIKDKNQATNKRIDDLTKATEEQDKKLAEDLEDKDSATNKRIDELEKKTDEQNKDLNNKIEQQEKDLKNEIENKNAATNEKIDDLINDIDKKLKNLTETMNKQDKDLYELIKAVTGAVDYESGNVYKKGEYVLSDGKLYVSLIEDNSYSITDATAFEETDIETIINNLMLDVESRFSDMQKYIDENNKKMNEKIEKETADRLAGEDALQNQISSSIEDINNSLANTEASLIDKLATTKAALEASDDANKQEYMKLIDDTSKNATDLVNATKAQIDGVIADTTKTQAQKNKEIADLIAKTNKELDNNVAALEESIKTNDQTVKDAIKDAKSSLEKSIEDVNTNLSSLADLLAQETANREASDKALQDSLNAINNYKYELRQNADGTHSLYITEVK